MSKLIKNKKLNIMSYQVYVANISQSGTNDPVPTIFENTIGTITWSRTGAGIYRIESAGLFTENKTIVFLNNTGYDYLVGFYASWGADTLIDFQTMYANEHLDDLVFLPTSIEIRVYP